MILVNNKHWPVWLLRRYNDDDELTTFNFNLQPKLINYRFQPLQKELTFSQSIQRQQSILIYGTSSADVRKKALPSFVLRNCVKRL